MKKRYHRLTLAEREEISRGLWAGENFSKIAERIGFDPSAISREVRKNVKRKRRSYSAVNAQRKADENNKKKGRKKKLNKNETLFEYVYEKLRQEWSPEEIAKRLLIDYPKDNNMRISHEAIYQHLYCLPRGELKKELMKGLRQNRKRRLSRQARHYRRQRIPDIISISERPEEAKDRIVPGHWEGDLIMGKNRNSALGSLVERTSRLTLLAPLKAKDAFSVRKAFAKSFKRIPKQFVKTLTYDRGSEMSEHKLFDKETKIKVYFDISDPRSYVKVLTYDRGSEMSEHKLFDKETKIKVYFADPHSPWQRGTNENTNGLIRQYFPKGTDFNNVSLVAIREAERRLNSRPRKVLSFYTPSERFYELITKQKIALET